MIVVKLENITVDPEIQLQSRGVDNTTVGGYIEAMSNGDKFPPIRVYDDGGALWLSAGFHRISAYRFLGISEVETEIRKGSRKDAMVDAAIDNKAGTRPMSQAQKREAGERLLRLTDWTQEQIARELAVDRGTVSKWKTSLEISRDSVSATRNGKTYPMDTSNIGKHPQDNNTSPVTSCDICGKLYDGSTFDNCPYCYKKRHGLRPGYIDGFVDLVNNDVDLTNNPPIRSNDTHLNAALNDEHRPVCQECGQVYDGEQCPDCKMQNDMSQPMQVLLSHESVEYYTPLKFIEAAREVMGNIDLDPASCQDAQDQIKASVFYTEAEDGLSQKWFGRVWLNPPYSKTGGRSNQEIWASRLIDEFAKGNVDEGIVLVKAALGYNWFEDIWDQLPGCFVRQRLSFIKNDGTDDGQSKHGTVLFYVGNNLPKFINVFAKFGRITTPDGRYIPMGDGNANIK